MKRYTADELRRLVAGHCREWGHGGRATMARQAGISPQLLTNFLAGRRGPPPALLDYYGLEKQVTAVYIDSARKS